MCRIGYLGDNMKDDDDRKMGATNNIIQIVIFALVGLIMITSVALPLLVSVISDNGLENTPIGVMIGMIPLLLIMGIVVWIANRMRGSDR